MSEFLLLRHGDNGLPGNNSAYTDFVAQVADEAGIAKQTTVDALGRLTGVLEDPTGLRHQPFYSYDELDDLLNVTQGSQTRTLTYDALKRLKTATNPESGTVQYF